jgi:hypothetical protein
MKLALAIAVTALVGCAAQDHHEYADDTPCSSDGGRDVFNPYTGACELETCPPEDIKRIAMADCNSSCTDLDEYACQSTRGCYAAFDQYPGDDGPKFSGCWQTATSEPDVGSCQDLDAYHCSLHDNCAIYYAVDFNSARTFVYCWAEPSPGPFCDDIECGPGFHCDVECAMPGGEMQCKTACVADDAGSAGACTGDVSCGQPAPQCPDGTTAGIANGCYTGYCIPDADCGPPIPGECYGDLMCGPPSPACPTGTTPGIADGCYTGYCIPDDDCAAAPCETLTTEGACASRMDCSAVYTGTSCTCGANGCTCQMLSFTRCESWPL